MACGGMACGGAAIGLHFDKEGYAVAYRITRADGSGRFNSAYRQRAGRVIIRDAAPAGAGVCSAGLHVTSAARAWAYFGVDRTCQFWRVHFHKNALLDCDGEKARIKGGMCMKIQRPF